MKSNSAMKKEVYFFLNAGIDGMKLNGIVNAACSIEELHSSYCAVMGYGMKASYSLQFNFNPNQFLLFVFEFNQFTFQQEKTMAGCVNEMNRKRRTGKRHEWKS